MSTGDGSADDIDNRIKDAMRDMRGTFPQGKLGPDDEGALAIGVTTFEGKVIIRFPNPVTWLGMDGDQAMGLAEALIKQARRAGSTRPLKLTI